MSAFLGVAWEAARKDPSMVLVALLFVAGAAVVLYQVFVVIADVISCWPEKEEDAPELEVGQKPAARWLDEEGERRP